MNNTCVTSLISFYLTMTWSLACIVRHRSVMEFFKDREKLSDKLQTKKCIRLNHTFNMYIIKLYYILWL